MGNFSSVQPLGLAWSEVGRRRPIEVAAVVRLALSVAAPELSSSFVWLALSTRIMRAFPASLFTVIRVEFEHELF